MGWSKNKNSIALSWKLGAQSPSFESWGEHVPPAPPSVVPMTWREEWWVGILGQEETGVHTAQMCEVIEYPKSPVARYLAAQSLRNSAPSPLHYSHHPPISLSSTSEISLPLSLPHLVFFRPLSAVSSCPRSPAVAGGQQLSTCSLCSGRT